MTTSIDAPNRDELPEYQKFKHLAGKAIHISAGARKYKIYQQTLSRWVKRGIIKTLGMDKNKVLIDEQDLAYCAWVQHQRPGTGKWLFDKDGLPYIPENSKD